MRLKLFTVFLGVSTLILSITVWYLSLEIKLHQKTIANRELTITSYAKVIDAICRSTTISLGELKTELITDFNLGTNGYSNYSSENYLVAHPISKEISTSQIWNFMGLELVFDNQKALKSVHLYKP